MRNNNKVQLLLIILVLALGIGYAYINSDLNINGTAQVRSANWDIHWANIAVTTGSVSAPSPTISNQTTVNYSVVLNTPGDYYEFTVDAVNGGSIDAMIDTISSKLNGATITTLPAYLKYSVTYSDGTPLEPNQQLLHNTTEKYKVRIEYNTDIELNQIPASNQTLSLQFTVTYRQATENSQEVEHLQTVYTVNDDNEVGRVSLNSAIPSTITQYNTAIEAMAAFENRSFYLKHILKKGIVKESYIEFVINSESKSKMKAEYCSGESACEATYDKLVNGTYALKGGSDEDAYEPNVDIIKRAFNYESQPEICGGDTSYFGCAVTGLYAYTYKLDGAYIGVQNDYYCYSGVVAFDSSGCYNLNN